RFQALEERNAKLTRLLRRGKAFTSNPLAQATDLDDLGSVKTHLDFEEAPLTPTNPLSGVGRLWGVGRGAIMTLRFLDVNGVVSEITHAPAVRGYHDAIGSVSNAAWGAMLLNQEDYDTDAIHSTNTSRLTATTAGKYRMSGSVSFAGHATGQRLCRILYNGTTIIATGVRNQGSTDGNNVEATTSYHLAAGDYVEFQLYQNSGGPLNVLANRHFEMEWIAP
ncbi:hypothetical protein LCGC14_2463320, partial [marine sediment metagenome]